MTLRKFNSTANYETKSILLTPDENTDKDTTEISTHTIAVP